MGLTGVAPWLLFLTREWPVVQSTRRDYRDSPASKIDIVSHMRIPVLTGGSNDNTGKANLVSP